MMHPAKEVMLEQRGRFEESGLPVAVGWFCAVTFVAATVITLLLAFDISAPPVPSQPAAHPNLLSGSVAFFANERQRWGQEVASGLLYFAAFAGLVALAILLWRRRPFSDVPSAFIATALTIGSTLAITSGLISLGAEQAAIDPHICDCKYSATQLIAQDRGLILANNASDWLIYGFFALAAVAFAIAAWSRVGWDMNKGWRYLSAVIAVLFVVGLIARAAGASTASDLIQGVGGGILIPVWAVWTGQALRNWLPSPATSPPPDLPPLTASL